MKKTAVTVALVCALMGSALLPSCIGSFALSNKLLAWNKQISNKFVNELVFLAFWILPVYEVSGLADIIVLNSIEFWSGENPIASASKVVEGNDGKYLVISDKKGYTVRSLTDNSEIRLNFIADTQSWAMELPDGSQKVIFSFVDDSHIALPVPGSDIPMTVELSESGLYAYQSVITSSHYALH